MSKSTVQWTDRTCNCVAGCDPISPGCANCYAIEIARRMESGLAGPQNGKKASHRQLAVIGQYTGLTESKEYTDRKGKKRSKTKWTGKIGINIEPLRDLLRIRGKERVFIASMGDLFHKDVPRAVQFAVLAVGVAKPNLTLQLVTKRVDVMLERLQELDAHAIAGAEGYEAYCAEAATRLTGGRAGALLEACAEVGLDIPLSAFNPMAPYPLQNVHLIASAERQKELDERAPLLLKCPAVVHGISAEPMLEELNFRPYLSDPKSHLRWIIPGGESHKSSAKARTCDTAWIRLAIQQVQEARARGLQVAAFVKQLGSNPVGGFHELAPSLQHIHRDADRTGRFRLLLDDGHGGDPAAWPADLRVREFPTPRRWVSLC